MLQVNTALKEQEFNVAILVNFQILSPLPLRGRGLE